MADDGAASGMDIHDGGAAWGTARAAPAPAMEAGSALGVSHPHARSDEIEAVLAATGDPPQAGVLQKLRPSAASLAAALRHAAAAGHHHPCEVLLAYGTAQAGFAAAQLLGPQAAGPAGHADKTALHLAAMSEQSAAASVAAAKLPGGAARKAPDLAAARTVQLLLAHGASVDARDRQGFVPLHYACMAGSTKVAEALLAADCDAKAETGVQDSALHLACLGGHIETAQLLLRHSGAPSGLVDQINADGWSALQLAIMTGQRVENQRTAALLLKSGANPSMVHLAIAATPISD